MDNLSPKIGIRIYYAPHINESKRFFKNHKRKSGEQ